MFEDSLVESTGRIHTTSRRWALGSLLLQSIALLALILFPLYHPDALPRQSMLRLLTAPAPPVAAASTAHAQAAARPSSGPRLIELNLAAPTRFPDHAQLLRTAEGEEQAVPGAWAPGSAGDQNGIPKSIFTSAPSIPAIAVVQTPRVRGPVHISQGVAAGMLISPIQPVYPSIARAAHQQGTVVVSAIISRQGTIENPQILEGPLMLREAALDAIRRARYRPYLLNGEPVEVETTICILFRLDG